MKFKSAFDIIGPIMIGPSSSHTAGAVRIGQIASQIFGSIPDVLDIHFFGSFAETYKGHATDVAIVGGVLGFETDDVRIKNAIEIADERDVIVNFYKEKAVPKHPNTVTLVMKKHRQTLSITGISVGGGMVQIVELDGFELHLTGEMPSLLVIHNDAYGAIAKVTSILAERKINIGHMEVSRKAKGDNALMVIETDQVLSEDCVNIISKQPNFIKVIVLK